MTDLQTADTDNNAKRDEQAWPLSIIDHPSDAFAIARSTFAQATFNEAGVCGRMGLEHIVDFKSRRDGRPEGARHGDALEVLVDLFMDLADVPESHARALLGNDAVDALVALGLVHALDGAPALLRAQMLLYPVAGVWLTSDRTFGRPGEERVLATDIVYPSITRSSHAFISMMPAAPSEALLEMCAGNGIAAISMAPRATHSWSLDITERATRVARFNARLNGFDNVTALQGDLFEPVRGLTFDRIVAHPPYVASAEQRLIYRDGGPDGELITHRIVAELPRHLRPGGRFYCHCVGTDRTDASFERRLSEWLGAHRNEFDIVVAVSTMQHPSEFHFKRAMRGATTFADAERRHLAFREMHVEALVYCSFIIQRHSTPRAPAVLRLTRSTGTTGREFEQLCDWLARRDSPDLFERMLASWPRVDRNAILRHTQRLAGDKWKDGETEVETTWPFVATITCPDDVAQLLARCDGTRTVKQVIAWLRQKGLLHASAPDHAVLQTLAACVIAGAVHLEDADHRAERMAASR